MIPLGRTASILAALALLTLAAACITEFPRAAQPEPPAPAQTATSVPTPLPTNTPAPTPTSSPIPTPIVTIQGLLDVRGPEDNALVRADSVVVHGLALPNAAVQIDGEPVELDDSAQFSRAVSLSPGVNTVTVKAETPDGTSESVDITVISLPPQPFFLIVSQPEDQGIVTRADIPLVGRTTAETIVTVNGVAVPVDISGVFYATITLEPGPNMIEVRGTSADGEELSARVTVIYE